MKILSFNVENDYRDDINKSKVIVDLVGKLDIDIIGLQEVTPNLYNYLNKQLIIYNQTSSIKYNISNQLNNSSYFNVIISKYNSPIAIHEFNSTSMNRTYLSQEINDNLLIITTHLESATESKNIRKKQVDEILEFIKLKNNENNKKKIIIFGDTNFSNMNETFDNLTYIIPHEQDIFSYDCILNNKTIRQVRTNLDRFYIYPQLLFDNNDTCNVKILKDIIISDHFPILLTINMFLCQI
jgi:endonuclease/exonuclease/phosphatase family metal-dependent hydrolase